MCVNRQNISIKLRKTKLIATCIFVIATNKEDLHKNIIFDLNYIINLIYINGEFLQYKLYIQYFFCDDIELI